MYFGTSTIKNTIEIPTSKDMIGVIQLSKVITNKKHSKQDSKKNSQIEWLVQVASTTSKEYLEWMEAYTDELKETYGDNFMEFLKEEGSGKSKELKEYIQLREIYQILKELYEKRDINEISYIRNYYKALANNPKVVERIKSCQTKKWDLLHKNPICLKVKYTRRDNSR